MTQPLFYRKFRIESGFYVTLGIDGKTVWLIQKVLKRWGLYLLVEDDGVVQTPEGSPARRSFVIRDHSGKVETMMVPKNNAHYWLQAKTEHVGWYGTADSAQAAIRAMRPIK